MQSRVPATATDHACGPEILGNVRAMTQIGDSLTTRIWSAGPRTGGTTSRPPAGVPHMDVAGPGQPPRAALAERFALALGPATPPSSSSAR